MKYVISGASYRAVPDEMPESELAEGEFFTENPDSPEVQKRMTGSPEGFKLTMSVIAARRYQAETMGITLDGMAIDTGRDSQALITGARLAGIDDPSYVCNWKTSTGFVQLDADTVKAIATAVRAHVQTCFDREAALLSALEAGTYKAPDLEEGWP